MLENSLPQSSAALDRNSEYMARISSGVRLWPRRCMPEYVRFAPQSRPIGTPSEGPSWATSGLEHLRQSREGLTRPHRCDDSRGDALVLGRVLSPLVSTVIPGSRVHL